MFYYNCIAHLFRPFVKLNMMQSSRTPKQICTDAANEISLLLRRCIQTYGIKRVGFMYTHCVMTTAIIQLMDVSETASNQSQTFLCEAIRALYEMKVAFPIVERYLGSIRDLTVEWCPQGVPEAVANALSEINIGSPTSVSSASSSLPPTNYGRRPSAPELILPYEEELPLANHYWNPNPYAQDGMPLGSIQNGGTQNMDILALLDSDHPELHRDGFTVMDNMGWSTSWGAGPGWG